MSQFTPALIELREQGATNPNAGYAAAVVTPNPVGLLSCAECALSSGPSPARRGGEGR